MSEGTFSDVAFQIILVTSHDKDNNDDYKIWNKKLTRARSVYVGVTSHRLWIIYAMIIHVPRSI